MSKTGTVLLSITKSDSGSDTGSALTFLISNCSGGVIGPGSMGVCDCLVGALTGSGAIAISSVPIIEETSASFLMFGNVQLS